MRNFYAKHPLPIILNVNKDFSVINAADQRDIYMINDCIQKK